MVDTLTIKSRRALRQTGLRTLTVAGGVGANRRLRTSLKHMGETEQVQVYYPRLELCTDNGAMIAYAGLLRLQAGRLDSLSVGVRPRWPLQELGSVAA